ncbi:ribosome maturation factor RimM [Leptospira ilyithenensis]|uniref:Ribosome maturation factor RimM n=1 Tax=Leptospira ilyithenensis TaxID=2484901 RepID=A0A4R9LQK8_9LEPT|nr:ribosome maturation factor RimM [Leptospira ilyithenensis]TGN08260.1 16S rRNA processing protein RimM [Leptospira ilyithenensis]
MSTDPSIIKVGDFGATHGIKGLIRIHTEGETLATLKTPIICLVELVGGEKKQVKILEIKKHSSFYLAKLEGYETPEGVVIFRQAGIFLKKFELPKPAPGEVYVLDLIGLEATYRLGEKGLGYFVKEVIDNAAHPILRFVAREEIEPKEVLVPFLNKYVGDWDLQKKQIEVVSWEDWFAV